VTVGFLHDGVIKENKSQWSETDNRLRLTGWFEFVMARCFAGALHDVKKEKWVANSLACLSTSSRGSVTTDGSLHVKVKNAERS